MAWAIINPTAGLVEPSDIPDYEFMMTVASPLLGDVGGVYTDWTPLPAARRVQDLYEVGAARYGGATGGGKDLAKVDITDPWQFTNFRTL